MKKLKPNICGQWDTFDDWVSRASRDIGDRAQARHRNTVGLAMDAMCIDSKGRRCFSGSDFHRARDENTFPVYFFWDCVAP